MSALSLERVDTWIFGDDAAVVRYANLPVTSSTKRVLAAMLIDREQDYCFDCVPQTIFVAVGAANRIVVIDAPVNDSIPIPSPCRDAAKADSTRTPVTEEDRFAGLRDCYAAAVRSDPRFSQIVAQAQALVDAVPDR